jgi:L-aspartate semialdehyde sulfurtransferase ferredoxin
MTNARVKLTFPEHLVKQPVIARLVREFEVMPNIRRASVEEHTGWIICELGGEADSVDKAIVWLQDLGIEVDLLSDVIEG